MATEATAEGSAPTLLTRPLLTDRQSCYASATSGELCLQPTDRPEKLSEVTVGSLVPTAVAAHAYGVTPDAIRMLRRRGKLTRHGTKQRALVDIDELAELAAERRGEDQVGKINREG